MQATQQRTRGMQAGMPNPGAFRKGDDPRRAGGLKIVDGKTLAQLAREHTPAAINFIARCMTDEEARDADRLKAAEIILDRGWGKAVSVVEMNVTHDRPARSFTRAELEAILVEGEPPPQLPILEREAAEVSTADLTADDDDGDVTQ